MNTNNKVALITGANKGIGFEIARQLTQAGCTVLLGARNPSRGLKAAEKIMHLGDVRSIELDLDRLDAIEQAANTINAQFGRLDILVNNAGTVDSADGLPSKTDIKPVRLALLGDDDPTGGFFSQEGELPW